MSRFVVICFSYLFMLVSLPVFKANAADVETAGDLKVTGGIIFPDDSVQRSACTGCADGILSIELGGTGSDNATDALENLGAAGLATLNTFTASQAFQQDVVINGILNLPLTSAANGIIKAGGSNLIHSYGNNNFFAGKNAGNMTLSGGSNTGVGVNALKTDSSGYSMTAVGYNALSSNTTGSRSTAIGAQAMEVNSEGDDNTAVGAGALQRNTTGDFNTAVGTQALNYSQIGKDNTALGTYAMWYNTSGNYNTATGSQALLHNSTGFNNTATGAYALQQSTGNHNTAVGAYALDANTTGTVNTAVGSDAMGMNTTGTYNTATGYLALASNVSGNSNTAVGVQSLQASTGYYNTAVGRGSLNSNIGGNLNSALGYFAGDAYSGGNQNTFIGASSDASIDGLTNATAIGYGALVDADNHVRIGNTSVTQIGGQVAWTSLSDMRAKRDIRDIGFGLDFIESLRPVQFTMKDGNDRTDFGFIAQDIEALIGNGYNILGIGGDPDRTLSLRYTDFIAPMVKAIQEQQGIIEAQKKKIEGLEERISRLEALIGD